MKNSSLVFTGNLRAFIAGITVSFFIIGCKKNLFNEKSTLDQKAVAATTSDDNLIDTSLENLKFVSNPTNLNVVMFVPKDNPALADYKTRLSQLLTYFQLWLHTEMTRYGYTSYLGLPKDTSGLVNIIEIPAEGNQADYPYDASISAGQIISEVKAYRTEHPSQFSSTNHYLVLLPARTDGASSQPFYGYGKFCFAVDNESMSIHGIPNTSSNYIGGMLHELGHGLNLAHNHAKYTSEEPTLGTSLMGSGNVTFSKGQPTFLTEVDAAILNRDEVFQPSTPTDSAYVSPSYTLSPKFRIDTAAQLLRITGTYSSNLEVSDILAYMDPKTSSSDADYNAVAWRFTPSSATSIYGNIDLSELYYKADYPYSLRLKLLLKNGTVVSKSYDFQYVDGLLTTAEDSVKVYSNASYAGTVAALSVGTYSTADLSSLGIADNSISSVKIGVDINVSVTLYDGDNCTGDSLVLTSSSSYVSSFNDKTSSIRIVSQ